MTSPLRILYLEDNSTDAELVQDTLESEGIAAQITRVETESGFLAELDRGRFDIILADHTLPSFDGLSALKIARQAVPAIPFLFVSGTLDEEVAIEALKIGATDYVIKTRLSRLVPSVRRALREAEERAELRHASDALRRSEAYLSEAQRLSHTGSFGWNLATGEIYWSRETFRIFEIEPATKVQVEMVLQRTHPDDSEIVRAMIERVMRQPQDFDYEHRLLMPSGAVKHLRVVGRPLEHPGVGTELIGAVTDTTERKLAEADLQRALNEIQKLRDLLYKENIALREEVDKTSMFEEIVGQSTALDRILANVARVAPTDSTVLVTGETGTGKELIARAIHKRSQRSSRAFVSVNCAAIPSTLIASELFGHEKGAFTGALQRRLGRFEMAEGGTIFLDEIGELPQETQIALLRVLQEREFDRVGGGQPIRADVRVIAATNRDLERAIEEGAFRRDLYYRLNVFPIPVPALRERREDIPTLVEYFVHRYSRKVQKRILGIAAQAMELLKSYGWPGNVRELQNVIERAVIVCDGPDLTIDPSWLSPAQRTALPASDRKFPDTEKDAIETALAAAGGRVSGRSGAAARLGMPASTLESKIRSLKINKYRFKSV